MDKKMEYSIDFKDVNSRPSMYTVILDSLDFPEWCGVTLDSIWDCLTDMLDDGVTIILDNYDCMEEYDREMADRLFKLFERSVHWSKDINVSTYKVYVVRKGVKTEIK